MMRPRYALAFLCIWLVTTPTRADETQDPWIPDSTSVRTPQAPSRPAGEKILDVFSAVISAPLYPLRGLTYGSVWLITESPLRSILFAPAPMTSIYPIAAYGSNPGYKGGLGFYSKNLFQTGDILRLKGYYSTHRYQRYGLSYDNPGLFGDRLGLRLTTDYRKKPWESFYGLGNDTRAADEASYTVERTDAEGALQWRTNDRLHVELFAAFAAVNVSDGENEERIYDLDSIAARLNLRPADYADCRHLTGGLVLDYDWRDHPGHPTTGGRCRLTAAYNIGLDISKGQNYYRLNLEFGHYFHLFNNRVLALRSTIQRVDRGADSDPVPFYARSGLGGSDLLRGYRRERFVHNDLVQVSLEYFYPVWEVVDGFVILEEGRVFKSVVDDFVFHDWKYSVNVGMRIWGQAGELARVLTAFSDEGTRFYIQLGADW